MFRFLKGCWAVNILFALTELRIYFRNFIKKYRKVLTDSLKIVYICAVNECLSFCKVLS